MSQEHETPRPEDEQLIEEEAENAAAEAARIGGDIPPHSEDPAQQPLVEAGQGEAEGFELAEKDLEDIASHGNQRGFPADAAPAPEEPQSAEYGEADEPTQSDD